VPLTFYVYYKGIVDGGKKVFEDSFENENQTKEKLLLCKHRYTYAGEISG
jgi:hypothetical protein